MKGHSEKALKAINEQGFSESKIKTSEQIFSDYKNSDFPLTPTIPNKWVPLDEAQKLEVELLAETLKRKAQTEATLNYAKMNKELEASLKRANMKLDTIDAVAKQLVHMTNLATKHKIQIEEALEIINGKDSRLIMDLDLFLRVREVLQK